MNNEYSPCEQHTLNNGNNIPVVALGTSRILPSETIAVITTAVDIGYRHFDTSEFYKNKTQLGDGLRQVLLSGKLKREELFITAKLAPCYEAFGDIETSLKEFLSILQLEYVDLCLLHFPVQFKRGYKKCNDETKLDGYINGKCDHVQLWKTECHAYLQIKGLVKFCQNEGIFITAFAPFGSPGLSKYQPFYKECDILKDEVVLDLARKYNRTSAQILLRHLIQRGIGVFPKSSDSVRLRENINIFGFSLTDEDMERMAKLDKGGRIFTFPFFKEHPQYPYSEDLN